MSRSTQDNNKRDFSVLFTGLLPALALLPSKIQLPKNFVTLLQEKSYTISTTLLFTILGPIFTRPATLPAFYSTMQ